LLVPGHKEKKRTGLGFIKKTGPVKKRKKKKGIGAEEMWGSDRV